MEICINNMSPNDIGKLNKQELLHGILNSKKGKEIYLFENGKTYGFYHDENDNGFQIISYDGSDSYSDILPSETLKEMSIFGGAYPIFKYLTN